MTEERKFTPEEIDFICNRLVDLAEKNPDVRRKLDDICFNNQTDQAPNSEAFATLQDVRDGLKTL